MDYVQTSSNPNKVVYLGVAVEIRNNEVHTYLHDREEDYPNHIIRYPAEDTVASCQQLHGVLKGRFIAALEACSYMQDFKESVANILRRAIWRGYKRRDVQAQWSRFLQQRWQVGDIRKRELHVWFAKVWQYLINRFGRQQPSSFRPQVAVRDSKSSEFLRVFGIVGYRRKASVVTRCPQKTSSSPTGRVPMDIDPFEITHEKSDTPLAAKSVQGDSKSHDPTSDGFNTWSAAGQITPKSSWQFKSALVMVIVFFMLFLEQTIFIKP
jgi:hypothetical protein